MIKLGKYPCTAKMSNNGECFYDAWKKICFVKALKDWCNLILSWGVVCIINLLSSITLMSYNETEKIRPIGLLILFELRKYLGC